MLCTTDTITWTLPLLYTVCYALWALSHVWILPLPYTVCYALWVLSLARAGTVIVYTICYALWVLSHTWVLLLLRSLCYVLRVPPHTWVLPSLYTIAIYALPHAWRLLVLYTVRYAVQLPHAVILPLLYIVHEQFYCHFITLCTAHVWHFIMMNNTHIGTVYHSFIQNAFIMICCLHSVYIHSSVHACHSSSILTTLLHV